MQIRKRIFKHTATQVLHFFSRQNLQAFDISLAFLPLTIAKLSTFKNGPIFLVHPVLTHCITVQWWTYTFCSLGGAKVETVTRSIQNIWRRKNVQWIPASSYRYSLRCAILACSELSSDVPGLATHFLKHLSDIFYNQKDIHNNNND